MKVLLLSRYDNKGASSRLRSYQYIPHLRKRGIEVVYEPLLGNEYLDKIYADKSVSKLYVAKRYLKRAWDLIRSGSFDLIWIEKELFPYLPAVAEKILAQTNIPYLVDYDDAVFHYYDKHERQLIRTTLGRKIDAVMNCATTVTVGNKYLQQRARNAGAHNIKRIPTPIDLDRYAPIYETERTFTIGWIGTPATVKYLELIEPALEIFSEKSNIEIDLIGAETNPFDSLTPNIIEWSHGSEVDNLQSIDVGVMPLPDKPLERGKCGYKLLQYMACGKPVIASPVGINRKIVSGCGYTAKSTEEWVDAFSRLKADHNLCVSLGENGYKKIEQQYALEVTVEKLSSALKGAAK